MGNEKEAGGMPREAATRRDGRSSAVGPRQLFISQVVAAADAVHAQVVWHSDQWVAVLGKGDTTRHIIGYSFPLNNAASAQIASDKAATYSLLAANGIPAIPHRIFRFAELKLNEWLARASAVYPLPVVVKPNMDNGGTDVYRAVTLAQLSVVLTGLATRYRSVALCPFVKIKDEYRVVMLDGEVRLVYRKIRADAKSDTTVQHMPEDSEWRHNLRLGAHPEVVDYARIQQSLVLMAQQSMAVLGLRFAAVDVVSVAGQFSVLEINSAVTLEHFSLHSPAYADIAASIYHTAIKRCFE